MRTFGFVLVMLLLLLLAAAFAVHVWRQIGNVEMSGAGIGALIVGVVLTTGLGVGLMWLVFYSSKRGYDDDVR